MELGLGSAATRLALNAVRCHMRVLTGSLPRGIVSTVAPSEPILALAATHILTRNGLTGDTSMYKRALSTLVEELILQGCVVERGLQGELLARLILVVTRDYALPRNGDIPIVYRCSADADEPAIETINLSKFLTDLLGDTLTNAYIRNIAHPRPTSAETLQKWAQPYVLNFTHFAQVSKNITVLSSEFLLECWRGGAGIACAFQQPVYDMLLIAYRGRLDEPFNPYDIGLVSVQVKLRANAAPTALPSTITCPDIAHDGVRWKPPHLAILMDLGTNADIRGSSGNRCEIGSHRVEQPVPNPDDQWQSLNVSHITESSRFVINIRGHAPYNVLEAGNVAEGLVSAFQDLDVTPVLEGMEELRTFMTVELDPYGKLLPPE